MSLAARQLSMFVIAFVLAAPAFAQTVYTWTDAAGVKHYGDRPPAQGPAETVAIEPPPPEAGLVSAPAPTVAATGAPIARDERQTLDIVMYATKTCGYCARARRYFGERGIPYLELDVDRQAQARVDWKRMGGKGVPFFVINGEISRGFAADSMTRRLQRYGW